MYQITMAYAYWKAGRHEEQASVCVCECVRFQLLFGELLRTLASLQILPRTTVEVRIHTVRTEGVLLYKAVTRILTLELF